MRLWAHPVPNARNVWTGCAPLGASLGMGRAFLFVKGPPDPIIFSWAGGHEALGADGGLTHLGALLKKETEASPGTGRRGVKHCARVPDPGPRGPQARCWDQTRSITSPENTDHEAEPVNGRRGHVDGTYTGPTLRRDAVQLHSTVSSSVGFMI